MKDTSGKSGQASRAPVIVVMGHIDHGKSTLLDYIRKTNLTEKEKGGITQHISAYEVKHNGQPITFLDTPGHEAFSGERERGSLAADIAILVVSAEDGVKPQTIEALNSIRKNKMPYLVAITKVDKPNANVNKVKQELAEQEVLLEGWGGTVPSVAISGKTGEGIDELLETVLLQAELEGFGYDPSSCSASGVVLESRRDSRRGVQGTLIIKEGVLKKGMFIRAGDNLTPVRSIENFLGENIAEAKAGEPVLISGWDNVPEVGAEFHSFNSKEEALKGKIENGNIKVENAKEEENTGKKIPLVIKADTLGSLEAVKKEAEKLNNDKVSIKIISGGVGNIGEAEIKLAQGSPEILILGFNVKVDSGAKDLALRNNINIQTFDIIYELTDWLGTKMIELTPREEVEELRGSAKIIKVFSTNKNKQVVGGKVEEGEIESNSNVKITRREVEIGEGRIRELQSQKQKVGKVEAGSEFGMLLDSKLEIAPGDKISFYVKSQR